MKKLLYFSLINLMLAGCNSNTGTTATAPADQHVPDTLSYLFKASYSSDITVPSNPRYAQKVLQVWKMFETAQIEAMKPYFADTVTYDDASGMHFHGPAASLLAFAKKDIENLDSMRFDISMWQSAHSNDRNEDWINIWSTERRYPKKGMPDTVLMQENWKVKEGLVVYFNQYLAKLPK
ncbi:MAG TPA: nuclear transport factor 2 family protein [Puia sp.]|nr:nuclear transport factor 2 family protein [Puia sp.]